LLGHFTFHKVVLTQVFECETTYDVV